MRKLQSEELHNMLYCYRDQIKEDKMVRTCNTYVEIRNAHKILGLESSRKDAMRETST